MTAREDRTHDIKDFLSRPIVIKSDKWSTTQSAGVQLYTANFPEQLIANSMYAEKLRGFVGLRATLVIRLQVNSQPFQQGRLMLQYFPYAQYMPARVETVNQTLQGRSGCPRTDLDLGVGTEVTMRIPYVSPHAYYNLVTGQGSFGSIFVVIYSPLCDKVTASASVEYTVWAHLEDIDIQYPTGADLFTGNSPNASSLAHSIATGSVTEKEIRQALRDKSFSKPTDHIYAQGGIELEQMKNSGVISSGLGILSSSLSTLSTMPVLGSIFSRPAWISAKAADLARMFGYSKPTTQDPTRDVKLHGQVSMANFDGVDTSHRMALSSCNELETTPGLAGTSADEMALSKILSIPNYWDNFAWRTEDPTTRQLWYNYVTPFKVKPISDKVTDKFACTHLGYVANTMTYWRGSLVYTFKFVKTHFHSGRVMISFIPFFFATDGSTTGLDTSKCHRMVVDVRSGCEVSFTVPYVSTRPWMFCIRPESTAISGKLYTAVTGIIKVEVLNTLVAPDTVQQDIDVIVEVNGGPDLTFAGPTSPSYIPYRGALTATLDVQNKKQNEEIFSNEIPQTKSKRSVDDPISEIAGKPIEAQSMSEYESIPRNLAQKGAHPETIDTTKIDCNWSPEANTIGEKVFSVRQLIKRFGYIGTYAFNNESQTALIVAPYSVPAPTNNLTAGQSSYNIGMLEYYYYLYAFWRGSIRLKASNFVVDPRKIDTRQYCPRSQNTFFSWNFFTSVQDTLLELLGTFTSGTATIPALIAQTRKNLKFPAYGMGASQQIVSTNQEGMSEIEVPYYNVSHICPATVYDRMANKPVTTESILKGHVPPGVLVATQFSGTDNPNPDKALEQSTLSLYRAAGDDYSLMYLVGVPPLINALR